MLCQPVFVYWQISIHAPREGGDKGGIKKMSAIYKNFNPRPPRGGRRPKVTAVRPEDEISIHAPREGGDPEGAAIHGVHRLFQSTPPARGATTAPPNDGWG